MSELLSRTVRIKRRLIDRLMGFERLYQTKLTDGQYLPTGEEQLAKPRSSAPNETGTPHSVEMQTKQMVSNRFLTTGHQG
jgi:hypothetical protein